MAPTTKASLIPVSLALALATALVGATIYLLGEISDAETSAKEHCTILIERHRTNDVDRYAKNADVAAMAAKLDETARRIDAMREDLADFRRETRDALQPRHRARR